MHCALLHPMLTLQMPPFSLLATLMLLVRARRTGQLKWARLPRLWEMLAEGYVIWRIGTLYRTLSGGRPYRGLISSWLGTAVLVAQAFLAAKSEELKPEECKYNI